MTDAEAMALGWAITTCMYFLSSLHFLRSQSRHYRSRRDLLDGIESLRNRLYDQEDQFARDFNQLNKAQKDLLEKNAMLRIHVENLRKANEGLLADNKKRLEDVFKACDEIAGLKDTIGGQRAKISDLQNTVGTLQYDIDCNSRTLIAANNKLSKASCELENLRKIAAEHEAVLEERGDLLNKIEGLEERLAELGN